MPTVPTGATESAGSTETRSRGRIERALYHLLWERVPRDHWQTPGAYRRRKIVCVLTVLAGAAVMGWSLRIEQGDPLFYAATFALAGVWVVGSVASGPLYLGRVGGRSRLRRPVVGPVLLGLALAVVFVVGAFIVRQIPFLEEQVESVLGYAEQGALPVVLAVTLVNGVAEELFFRGAAYAAVPRHQVLVTTVAYALTVAATGNLMLAFAAVVLGVVVGLERRASGGVMGPILTHLTWSTSMLLLLPLLF